MLEGAGGGGLVAKARLHLQQLSHLAIQCLKYLHKYDRLGPGGEALHHLHWVAGDGHRLRDGLEYRQRLSVGQ